MSRLASFIDRLMAQRACIETGLAAVASLDGPLLELGLGNGRTYDHLRTLAPGREIFVFERRVAAHPDCVPDPDHLILGDFRDTLATAGGRIGRPAAFAHADIGTGDKSESLALAGAIGPALGRLLAPGAVIAADQPFGGLGWQALDLPPDVAPGRYHLYRVAAP